ncbi:hypothetical protein D9601_03505 [Sphingomonas sp. MA1305]|uniref:hypothetical protein n=1 Tax=Sphingomonas sp. MA1305 TaxID=2479204 RepID=UPI0018DEFA7F|nr:hypothetical protein [Sphingomonas sp. MA1305]MBI0474430.1 hypothetical protein [Sphingomonas sp. MA1305]
MANKLYPKYKQALLTAGVNLVSGTVKAQLVDTSTYTYSDTHQFLSDVPAAARYGTAATLANKTVVNGLFDADDALFTSVPAGSSGSTDKEEAIILYLDTGTASTSQLIYYIDTATGLPVTPNGGNIVVSWDANGIFQL